MKLIKTIVNSLLIYFFVNIVNPSFAEQNILKTPEFENAIRQFLIENPEVIFEAIENYENQKIKEAQKLEKKLIQKYSDLLFEDNYSFIGGNKEGSITIVAFIDYKCGYCKKAHIEVSELISNNSELKYIMKEYPILGSESILASKIAIHILLNQGDKVYREFNDKLLKYNGTLSVSNIEKIIQLSGGAPVNVEAIIKDNKINLILKNNQLLANELGVQGTPTFIIGNQIIRGYKPKNVLQEIINNEKQAL